MDTVREKCVKSLSFSREFPFRLSCQAEESFAQAGRLVCPTKIAPAPAHSRIQPNPNSEFGFRSLSSSSP
jgi:hypothetical protein